jgi:RNA polymerase sigma-70 factor (ECF subfamily)
MTDVRVDDSRWLAQQFETQRTHLRGVAFRMLGSLSDADDAVQEAWLRLERNGPDGVRNLGGWLTTVVARVCLDMLRSRRSRREELVGVRMPAPITWRAAQVDADEPEEEALLADSVGTALLVVLDRLTPAERLAFVLHDTFAVPFDEIAPIVGCSTAAARQLASRARRRVRGAPAGRADDLDRQREIVEAFLTAAHNADFDSLLVLLDPEVVVRVDEAAAVFPGAARETRGAMAVARRAVGGGSGATLALVDGIVCGVVAPLGQLLMVLRYTIARGRIVEIEGIADPERLRQFDIRLLDD